MNTRNVVGSLVAVSLSGSTIGYSAATSELSSTAGSPTVHTEPIGSTIKAPGTNVALPDFSALVSKYGNAVVNITVTVDASTSDLMSGVPQPDPDAPFFDPSLPFQRPLPRQLPMYGVGSGFIVRSDGVILTNAHVVDDAKEVEVRLVDRREFKAQVLGVDKLSDIAVIKIDARNLPTAKLGNPANLKPGDWVVAIGSPFGLETSVTRGIVSAKSRTLPDHTYVPFIQTDAAINPGNSGGPLFDRNGEVIGVNSQIYSRVGGYQGLAFAIPIDIAVNVENQILQNGRVTRARLGVTAQEVTQDLADAFGLEAPDGALVASVEPGSPAAEAGLQSGDVILKLNDERVTDLGRLPVEIAQMKPGTVVKLEVFRSGAREDVSATLGALETAQLATPDLEQAYPGRLGLAVRPLTSAEREEDGDTYGLVVEDVTGAAARAGIQPGDVILSVNGAPVNSARELRELVSNAGEHIALLVQRDGFKLFVPVDFG